MTLQPGQILLHYRLAEKIGEGGMGVVWRALDTTLDRDVAIKILPEVLARDAERLARFEREAKLLASLNDPNIAGIYGIHESPADGSTDSEQTTRFLAMELVAGEDLAQRLSRGALPRDEALDVALQIARAFEAAHESGVIHRDLKPANVKLTPGGQVKVLDFGLAKALSQDPSQPDTSASMSPTMTSAGTVVGMILGTAAYMSPEQAKGKLVDRRADIWSFGVVLFEMLSGTRLFEGETISETLAAVLMKEIDLSPLPADTPRAIRNLLQRCLRRNPMSRLRDIGDARIALQEVLEGTEIDAPVETPTLAVGDRRRSNLERGLLIAALVAAIGWGLWGWLAGSAPRGIAADWQLSIVRPVQASGAAIAISPDGSTVAFGGRAGIRLRRLDRQEPSVLEGTEEASFPFWSPDGRSLGFYQEGELKRISVASGLIESIAEGHDPGARGTWLERGRILFNPGFSGLLMSVPAAGGAPPTPLTEKTVSLGAVADHRYATPLPDAERFLFVEREYSGNTSSIRVGSFDSLETRVLMPPRPGHISFLSLLDSHVLYVRDSVLFAHPFDPERAEFTGDPKRLLGGAKVSGFSVSANGVLAWVPARDERESRVQLTWLDRSGQVLTTLADLPDLSLSPRLSPDESRVVFNAQAADLDDVWALHVYDLVRSSLRRLVSSASLIGNWSPDGTQVAFFEPGKISITDANGTGTPKVVHTHETSNDDEFAIPSDWSPDGRHIAFTRAEAGDSDVWVLPVGSGEPFVYADGRGTQRYASFAPNGKWVAYTSDESGRNEVYVDSFPTRGTRVQVSTKGGIEPHWRGNGRELFYANGEYLDDYEADEFEFYSVDVEEKEGGLNLGTPVLLFQARAAASNQFYDVSADGQRFLVPIMSEPEPRPIHVVTDWENTLPK